MNGDKNDIVRSHLSHAKCSGNSSPLFPLMISISCGKFASISVTAKSHHICVSVKTRTLLVTVFQPRSRGRGHRSRPRCFPLPSKWQRDDSRNEGCGWQRRFANFAAAGSCPIPHRVRGDIRDIQIEEGLLDQRFRIFNRFKHSNDPLSRMAIAIRI